MISNEEKLKSVHIVIQGDVQMVGYRYYAQMIANKLGISGSVKNLYNGNVEIKACGPENILENFINYIKQGPSLAYVENITITPLNETLTSGFRIRY